MFNENLGSAQRHQNGNGFSYLMFEHKAMKAGGGKINAFRCGVFHIYYAFMWVAWGECEGGSLLAAYFGDIETIARGTV